MANTLSGYDQIAEYNKPGVRLCDDNNLLINVHRLMKVQDQIFNQTLTAPVWPEGSPTSHPPEIGGQPSTMSITAQDNVPGAVEAASKITFDDWLALSELTFEWADSYDNKDWPRLRAILAPTLKIDYSEVNGHRWESMSADEFVGMMSHVGFVGDPLVHTQHHIGASKFQKISDDEVVGHHQLRAAHQRYTSEDKKTVENKGHGHATIKHFYKKVEGVWKFAGLKPTVHWNEFDFEKIFTGLL